MLASLDLWIEYIIRFSHLVAGISWIGSSFYFIWLDSSFEIPKIPKRNVEGEVFMVHGGFYYQVEKRKIYPGELPDNLHWFKWEATLTWITGILLLVWLYYLKGASLLLEVGQSISSPTIAILSSIGMIIGSWFIYDLIWHPDWMKNKKLSLLASLLFFSSLIYLYFTMFSGRGAFIQTGATFGSLMLFNVWVRILPGQKKMIAAAQAGQVPDYSVSLKSKTRSVHNTYFTFPVLFIMLSNHYPQIYNHDLNWLLLVVLGTSGALVRHAMVTKSTWQRWTLFPAAMGLLALVFMTRVESSVGQQPVEFSQIQAIVANRCISCHSTSPTDDIFKEAPKGLVLHSQDQILAAKAKIIQQVVMGKTMPLANKTNMTDEERQVFHTWLAQFP